MSPKKKQKSNFSLEQALAEARRREKTYRERALKIFPHICARCGREFTGVRLRELTVHHIDHDHENNPPDGSNWELLCLYCHENEHSPYLDGESYVPHSGRGNEPVSTFKPFANLGALLNSEESSTDEDSDNSA